MESGKLILRNEFWRKTSGKNMGIIFQKHFEFIRNWTRRNWGK